MRYAKDTSVPVERSKAEIERVLSAYGATKFMQATSPTSAAIAFEVNGRAVRMTIELPVPGDFIHTPKNKTRPPGERDEACRKATRQRWRALLLVIKAKLEAVEGGIATFDSEWMPYLLLPNGKTVGEELLPRIEAARAEGKMPPLLLGMEP